MLSSFLMSRVALDMHSCHADVPAHLQEIKGGKKQKSFDLRNNLCVYGGRSSGSTSSGEINKHLTAAMCHSVKSGQCCWKPPAAGRAVQSRPLSCQALLGRHNVSETCRINAAAAAFLHPSFTCSSQTGACSVCSGSFVLLTCLGEFKPHRRAAATHVFIYRLNVEDIEAAARPKVFILKVKSSMDLSDLSQLDILGYLGCTVGFGLRSAKQGRKPPDYFLMKYSFLKQTGVMNLYLCNSLLFILYLKSKL